MAEQIFGLDFGTTNSLLSVIGQDGHPIHFTDEIDRPHPSVVWYRGGEVIVGRKARQNLDAGAEAITSSLCARPSGSSTRTRRYTWGEEISIHET